MTRKIYEVLADCFAQENIETCFALIGDANMNFATSLAEKIGRMVYVRHEHCGVAAAMAYARKTGKTGVATVTCGPGLTQIFTALPAAVRAKLPLVIFAGEAPLKSGWYNQAIDQAPFVKAAGAIYHTLHHPERMPEAIRDAFLEAQMKSTPVVVGVPFDLQERDWEGKPELPAPSHALLPRTGPIPPNPDDVARAAELVARSKRIVVMAGMGAVYSDASDACRNLARKVDGLLATTLPARGLFYGDPYCVGIAGGFSTAAARDLLGEADLVIAVGTILAQHNADSGKLFGQAHVLQIDVEPVTVSQGRIAANSHIRADGRLGVEALSAAIEARAAQWRSNETAEKIRFTPADPSGEHAESGTLDPRDVVAALDSAIPQEWELVNSSGHCSFYFAQMPDRPYKRFLTIREFGAIGNGISFAMGVAAAQPDSKVVLFDGDGSLMMHVQELETIRRSGLDILICVLNDGAYGSEIHKLRAEGLSDEGAVFGRPDFASIAKGFGLGGHHVDDLSALPALIADWGNQKGAAILDFPISDQIRSPVIRRAHPHRTH